MPASNKRFCEMAVELLAQMVVLWITFGRNPNCNAVDPPLRKAAGTLSDILGRRAENINNKKN